MNNNVLTLMGSFCHVQLYRKIFTCTLLSIAGQCFAGSAQWSSTNFQYLYGDDYVLGDETRSIITLEHVNGWALGDNFYFVDITNPDRNGEFTSTNYYGEISPRLSFSKMTGKDLSFGIVQDILFTGTAEIGQGFHTYLYGIAVDLKLPKFAFFQVNYYVRNEIAAGTDLGNQLTLVWGLPFEAGKAKFMFEGFYDYAWAVDPSEDNVITGPRLLLDIGNFFGKPGNIQAGIEYQIWKNKFGIDGVDEDVAQWMIKWIF